jgi:hypothetical protein
MYSSLCERWSWNNFLVHKLSSFNYSPLIWNELARLAFSNKNRFPTFMHDTFRIRPAYVYCSERDRTRTPVSSANRRILGLHGRHFLSVVDLRWRTVKTCQRSRWRPDSDGLGERFLRRLRLESSDRSLFRVLRHPRMAESHIRGLGTRFGRPILPRRLRFLRIPNDPRKS